MEMTLEVTGTETNQEKQECDLAARAKEAAAKFLSRRGYEIIDRDWHCRAGIADLVCMDDDALVFIKVKARSDSSKGFPSEEISHKKRDQYEKIAMSYLASHSLIDAFVRFDVVSIVVLGPGRAFLRHHVNAFGAM